MSALLPSIPISGGFTSNPIVQQNGIYSASWSLMLDRTAGGPGLGLGNAVQGIADIDQCITIIVTTVPGTDPLRSTFGSDIFAFMDMPPNIAVPKIVAAISASLQLWEPRIVVASISAQRLVNTLATWVITVVWKLNLTLSQNTTTFTTAVTLGQPTSMVG